MERGCAAVYRRSGNLQLMAGGSFIWPERTVGKASKPGVYSLLVTPSSTKMRMKYRYGGMRRVGMHKESKWSWKKFWKGFAGDNAMTIFAESNYLVLGLSKTVWKCNPQLFFTCLWSWQLGEWEIHGQTERPVQL